MGTNTVRQHFGVSKEMRNKQLAHRSFLIWFTGLSGAGKSTIANELELALHGQGIATYLLDGDNVRQGLNSDLTFSQEGRAENLRRIAEVAHLMVEAGTVVLAAFIAPNREDREKIKQIIGAENYIEVYIATPLNICEERDVKGLYKRARKGEIPEFTGISSPYDTPENPDLTIDTSKMSLPESVEKILAYISPKLIVHE